MQENKTTAKILGRVWNILKRPVTIVPEEVKPDGSKTIWEKYPVIEFFTHRNQFAKDMLLLSEISTTHRSCIYTKADYQYGEGFGIAKGKSQTLIKTKTKAEEQPVEDSIIQAATELVRSVNNYKETLSEVCRQVRINLEASGNGYIECVWGEHEGEKYFRVYSHDFHKVLFVRPENSNKTASHVFISEDWSDDYISKVPPVKLPLYPNVEFVNGSFRCIMHVKQYSIGRDFYGLPGWIAGKIAGQLEYEADSHNLTRFFSDFMPRFFAAFFAPEGMTTDQKEKFYEDFLNTYTKKGRDGSVSAMVQVFESESMKPYFHEFNNKENDGDFIELKGGANQSMFTAHRWHPVLAGIPISSGLNDSKQIQNIFNIYNKLTIRPNQVFDLNNFINPIWDMMCEWLNSPCKEYQLTLESSSPVSFFDSLDVNSLITVDEGRKFIGEDKIGDERGRKTIAEMKSSSALPKPPVP